MNKVLKIISVITIFSASISAVQAELYEVTITNLTRGQIFSPVFAATHSTGQLFTAGQPALPQLAALAQDADASGLNTLLSSFSEVHEIVSGTGVIPPGKSETISINGDSQNRFLTLVSMLVVTNDAFLGVNRVELPSASTTFTALAYDAGSEDNDESCAYIPGPPCGNEFASSGIAGEGFVHIHNGIHGIGDLTPVQHDWKNPVARITIRLVN